MRMMSQMPCRAWSRWCGAALLGAALGRAAVAAPADCVEPARAAALMATVNVGEAAFAAADRAGFVEASTRVDGLLRCMDEVFEPGDAAALHRFMALRRYFDKDLPGAEAALRGWLATNREAELSLEVAPEGHPLRALFIAAEAVQPAASVELAVPAGRSLGIDGRLTRRAVGGRPFVGQLLDGEGKVLWTAYEADPSVAPAWLSVGPTPVAAASTAKRAPNRRLRRGVVAGSAALGAGGLYAAARVAHNEALSLESPVYAEDPAEVDQFVAEYGAAQRRANTLSLSAAGLGLVALGFGVSVAF
jgi:hypothetical protein